MSTPEETPDEGEVTETTTEAPDVPSDDEGPLPEKLAGAKVQVKAPRIAHRLQIVSAAGSIHPLVHYACALALCWPRLQNQLRKQRNQVWRGNMQAYGEHALELLVENGASAGAIFRWGQYAVGLCAKDLPGSSLEGPDENSGN
jgi:hypothetical protein